MKRPFRIAAIVTTFFPESHAGVLVTKFLRGFPTDEGLIPPRTQLASLSIDQIHERDVGLQLAQQSDVPVFESIRAALTLGGPDLAVDAVLLIGEHGDYPVSELGQEMLPRRYFFEQICGLIAEAGRPIPVFNDKFLAYRWEDARWMYETARTLEIPLWAGSAMPLAWTMADYRKGDLQVQLLGLEPGKHLLQVEAWDTYNNWASESIAFRVAHAVDALGNVQFYPNPMRDGGHFTFSLSQGSHAVHIQVFAIAGRLVAELQGTGTEGYNQIAWRPDQELANGTYLYKISAGGPEGSFVA